LRPVWRYLLATALVVVAVVGMELLGISPRVNGPTAAEVLLLVLIIDGSFFGTGAVIVASFIATAAFSRYFVTPTGFAVGDRADWAQLIAFIILAVVVGELASRAERRAREAHAGRQEIARLYQELEAAFDRASEAEGLRRNEQLKAALLDALSHNLRTPLTSIKASVTALIGAVAAGETPSSRAVREELLQVIDEESDRLNRFIEGLSAAGSGATPPLAPHPVAVDDVVRVGLTRAETLTRDHQVQTAIGVGLPKLLADRAAIAEVLYILLDNASKYSPPGSTIRVSAVLASDAQVELSVADQGPGIPPAARERVFERFFRVQGRQSFDPRRKGVGLGLSIARRLVDVQGGRLWVDSPAGGFGTVMRFTVPVAAGAASGATQDAQSSPVAVA
jgi:K+-sensing histidine kinase KdpD